MTSDPPLPASFWTKCSACSPTPPGLSRDCARSITLPTTPTALGQSPIPHSQLFQPSPSHLPHLDRVREIYAYPPVGQRSVSGRERGGRTGAREGELAVGQRGLPMGHGLWGVEVGQEGNREIPGTTHNMGLPAKGQCQLCLLPGHPIRDSVGFSPVRLD